MWHCWAVPKLSSVCLPMIRNGFLIELMWGWVPLTCVLSLDLQRRSSRSLQSSRLEWRRQNPWYNDITSPTGLCLISVESFRVKCFADRCLPIHKTLACPVWCWNSLTVPELDVVSWTSYCPIWASDSEDGPGGTNLTTKGESNPSCQAERIQVWSEHAKARSEEVSNSNWSSPFYEGWPSRHWPAWQSSKGMIARNLVYKQITCKQVKAIFPIPVLDLHLFL